MKTVNFSETIGGSDLKVGRCKQLIEFMKICEYTIEGQCHFFTRFCMFCGVLGQGIR